MIKNKTLNIFSVAKEAFGSYKRYLVILVLLGLFSGLLEGLGINIVIPLLSFVIGGNESSDFITKIISNVLGFFSISFSFQNLLILIVLLFISRMFVLALFTIIKAKLSADIVNKEMKSFLSSILYSRWSFLLNQRTGYLHTSLIKDVYRCGYFFEIVVQIIQSFTGFLMYLVIAISISPKITFVTLVAGTALIFFFKPIIKKAQSFSNEVGGLEKRFSQFITEHMFGMKSVKTSGKEAMVLKNGFNLIDSLSKLQVKSVFIGSLGHIIIQPFGLVFIVIIFAFVYKTPGFNIAAFAATLYLIQKIFIYLESGQGSLHSMGELSSYVSTFFKYKKEIADSREINKAENTKLDFFFENEILFKNVNFSYNKKDDVLLNLNLSIKKGETIGLVGPSGSGKTSIADLLLRLFNPESGVIQIDGRPIDSINIYKWRDNIGYVSQDIFLLNETIFKNIQFYDDSVKIEDVILATKKANIFDYINNLPDKFETLIGERGITISAGQRQRIVLARALVRKPKILILDEATSALDRESEIAIQKAVQEIHGSLTVLIIAHRLSTVMSSDRLLVIGDKRIIEEGKPKELLDNPNSVFYKYYHGHSVYNL